MQPHAQFPDKPLKHHSKQWADFSVGGSRSSERVLQEDKVMIKQSDTSASCFTRAHHHADLMMRLKERLKMSSQMWWPLTLKGPDAPSAALNAFQIKSAQLSARSALFVYTCTFWRPDVSSSKFSEWFHRLHGNKLYYIYLYFTHFTKNGLS